MHYTKALKKNNNKSKQIITTPFYTSWSFRICNSKNNRDHTHGYDIYHSNEIMTKQTFLSNNITDSMMYYLKV